MTHARLLLILLTFAAAGLAPAQSTREEVLRTVESLPHPNSETEFQSVPHLPCLNQGQTMICWSFATSSFIESEMARLKQPPIRLSVIYPAYCQFLEKARRFVETKGNSRFSAGDLFTGVPEVYQKYGALPAEVYDPGLEKALPNHDQLYSELDGLMQATKKRGQWDEARVVSQVTGILNHRLGEPPKTFSFNGKNYTPKTFAAEVVNLPWDEYVMFTSFESAPFHSFTDLKVPDNWRHNTNYYNLPLADFYETFKRAVRTGYSVAVSIDTSEPSYQITGRYCLVPDFDIPRSAITQAAREFRFKSGATTDDHAIHIIGYNRFGDEDWFLAKDSWRTTWKEGNRGCLFLHSSYVKLKILAFIVHRDGTNVKTALGQTALPGNP